MQVSEDAPDMFLMDIQRDQVEGVRAFLADPAHGGRAGQTDSGAAGAGHRCQSAATRSLESFEDVRARGSLARDIHGDLSRSPGDNESDRRRRVLERSVGGSRSVGGARVSTSDSRSTSGIRFASTSSAGSISAEVTSIREVDWRDARRRRLHVRLPSWTCSIRCRSGSSRRSKARAESRRVRDFSTTSSSVRKHLGHRFPRHPAHDPRRHVKSDARHQRGRRTGAVQRRTDPHRRGGDDQFQRVYEAAVFKTLGASTCAIARMLLFEYGVLGCLAGAVGSLGAVALDVGREPFRAGDPMARLCWRAFRWRAGHGDACRGNRRSLELRRPAKQATADPPGRVNRPAGCRGPELRVGAVWSGSMPPGARRHEWRRLDPLVYLFAALSVARYAFLR